MEQINARLISWASILDDNARRQAVRTSRMPFVHPHLALMPDAHWGMGATVGSVIPTLGAIMPAAIGVDIGCGMMALRTTVRYEQVMHLDADKLREYIANVIPLSAGQYNEGPYDLNTEDRIQELSDLAYERKFDPASYAGNWKDHLGSLGSGNHFIEVCKDEEGLVWLFLHSGSRGVGNKIATHHIKVAKGVMEKYFIELEDPDLAYLVEGTEEFWKYMREMQWAQEFARLNRVEMMYRVRHCFDVWVQGTPARPTDITDYEVTLEVNCHHNYTQPEHHFGKDVWLSRKGAIDASEGTWGLIPGSMGDLSYVVQGKGYRPSLNSAPHGAGRQLGRKQAERTFDVADLTDRMQGVAWDAEQGATFLDEHPSAYKPIDVVMKDADDLVEVCYVLKQFVNVKGASGIERRAKKVDGATTGADR